MNDRARPAWLQRCIRRRRESDLDRGLEAAGKIIAVFFFIGFAVGGCVLGLKLPSALLDLAIK